MSEPEAKLTYGQALSLAVVAAVAAVLAALFTNIGQQNVAKDQFIRSESAAAYADFVGASEDLLRVQRNASFLFEPGNAGRTQIEGQDEIDALGAVNVSLQSAAAKVKLIGEPDVANRATAIVKKMESLSDVYYRGFEKLNPTPGAEVVAAFKAESDPLYADYYRLKEEFLESVAKQLAE